LGLFFVGILALIGYRQGWFEGVGGKARTAGSDIANAIASGASTAGRAVTRGVSTAGGAVTRGASKFGNAVKSGASQAATSVGKTITLARGGTVSSKSGTVKTK
jgi:hypothetical protein